MSKIALVTGGNSGIGFATSKLFAEKGYSVYLAGRNRDEVKKAADKIEAKPLFADMSRMDEVRRLADHFSECGLDVLVNNAGVVRFIPLPLITQEDLIEFFNINVFSGLLLIQELLPALEKKKGCVVSVSSAIVNNGLPNASLYAATKGSIDAFTRSLALELAPKGIRVNAVAPGPIETPLLSKLGFPEEALEAIKAHHESIVPLGRFGQPEEVAQVIVAQAEATYVTGSVWAVDGGTDAI